jgi:hypothetical protein
MVKNQNKQQANANAPHPTAKRLVSVGIGRPTTDTHTIPAGKRKVSQSVHPHLTSSTASTYSGRNGLSDFCLVRPKTAFSRFRGIGYLCKVNKPPALGCNAYFSGRFTFSGSAASFNVSSNLTPLRSRVITASSPDKYFSIAPRNVA